MINIASSQPVHWPVAPAPAVAPVASVTAVTPTQRTPSDGGSNLGSDRDTRSAMAQEKRSGQTKTPASSQAAPLLPREWLRNDRSTLPDKDGMAAKEQAREAETAKADSDSKTKKLMEVLSTVWRASAAVVEDALGLESSGDKEGARGVGPPASRAQAASSKSLKEDFLPGDIADPDGELQDPLLGRAAGDPVAYTEQGTSSWAPLETGQLIRKQA